MVEKLKEALPDMWRSSPPWFALLAVIVLFLLYLDRQESRVIEREKRAEALSSFRIETCHAVQAESTDAIKRLNEVLSEQVVALELLKATLED